MAEGYIIYFAVAIKKIESHKEYLKSYKNNVLGIYF